MDEKNTRAEKEMTEEKKAGSARTSFKTRAFKAGSYSFMVSVIAVIIAVVVNLLFAQLPGKVTKLDLTSKNYFTLSDQTEQLVKSLEEDVTIYWLVQTGKEDTYIEELLHRYEDLSSKLKVEKIDHVIFPNFAEAYTDETISDNSVIVVCGDNSRYVDYDNIYVKDNSAFSTVEFTTLDFAGEEAITSSLLMVTSGAALNVYELSGHGEKTLKTYSSTLASTIERENYTLSTINLNKYEAVPEDCACLLLISPQNDISPQEKDKIITYLQAGGKMMIITDAFDLDTPNFDSLLAYYGVELIDGVIVENDTDYYNSLGQLYLMPKMTTHVITQPLVSQGYSVILPGAQGIGFLSDTREGVYYGKFLNTSEASYSKAQGYNMSTTVYEDGDIRGPFTVGCAITESVGDLNCRVCMFTTTYLLNDNANQMAAGANFDMMVNALNWTCNVENRISIRAKSMNLIPLKFPTGTVQNRLTLFMIVILPLIPLIIALLVTYKRRRR